MIKEFVEKWEKNKNELEQYFRKTRQKEYQDYETLVKLLFKFIINNGEYDINKYDIEDIKIIDDGSYQGTEIFILHKDTYQPSVEEYVYTYVYYGSCSCCDTLQSINNYNNDIPTENQIKDYMTLELHLLQKCKYFE